VVLGEICNAFFFIELMLRLWCTLGKNILRPAGPAGGETVLFSVKKPLAFYGDIFWEYFFKDYTFGISRLGLFFRWDGYSTKNWGDDAFLSQLSC